MAIRRALALAALIVTLVLWSGCQAASSPTMPPQEMTPSPASTAPLSSQPAPTSTTIPTPQSAPTAAQPPSDRPVADVMSVGVQGEPGSYTFSVEVESSDRGCEQYADWWEVVSEDGALVYRRVLLHSHVNEQPFVRSGGPVAIQPGTSVWVRAHMHPGGYGGQALHGSVEAGFSPADMPPGFAEGLADQPPLPDGCAF